MPGQGLSLWVSRLIRYCCALAGAACVWTSFARPVQAAEAPILRANTGSHTAPIRALDVDKLGRFAVTAADDKTASVWDLASGKLLQVLRPTIGAGNEGNLYAAAITPDGVMVAVGGWSADNDVYLFDRSSGALLHRITGLPDVVTQLSFSPDGQTLAIGLFGKNGIRTFASDNAWRNSRETGSDTRFEGTVSGAKFSPDGARLAVASTDGQVRVYAVAQRSIKLAQTARLTLGRQPFGVAWSPNNSLLAVGFADAPAVAVLKADSLQLAFAPDVAGLSGGGLNAVAWSADGSELLAAGTWRRTDHLHGLRRWRNRGQGPAIDESLASNSVVGIQALADGRVVYASTAPAWGWLERTALVSPSGTSDNHAISSGLADFRNTRNAFRLSRDGAAIAFPLHDSGSSMGAAVGFDLPQANWTEPQAQWKAPGEPKAPLAIGNWFEGAQPTLNGRPLALAENEVSMSVALAPDNTGFALGTSLFVRYYKADGSELWHTVAPGTTWQVNVSGDRRWVVAGFSDGTVRWYRAQDGSEQLILYPHPDRKRWVLWSPSGYYAAAPGAEDLVGWHLNRGKDLAADFFPASRFRAQFYRPDVIAKVIETGDGADALRLADLGAKRKSQPQTAIALPPVVEIMASQERPKAPNKEIVLQLGVRTPGDAPVLSVRVRVNGLLQPDVRVQTTGTTASGDTRDVSFALANEDADIQVFAENRNGVSLPATLTIKGTASKPPKVVTATLVPTTPSPLTTPTANNQNMFAPKLYVLAVGLSTYKDTSFNLGFAAKDAGDFSKALALQKGTLYRDVEVKLITDKQATKDDVLDGLEWLKREVTARDVGILFLAGHGLNDNAGNYYFLPHDGNPEQLLRTGVAHNDIKLALNSIAGKALFFIDSCHSGNALGTAKTRGLIDVNAIVNDLTSAENGVVVFAASTGRQYSRESPDWGNGAFTKAVVEGLMGKADFRKTGVITHKALDFYVAERVKELTKGQQSPVSIAPQGVGDFPIAVVKR